ncbi:MAG: MFS transporter [Nitriliruptorales bacterium]|nr:MFS transporter [Nitriliruptorales bacterium]
MNWLRSGVHRTFRSLRQRNYRLFFGGHAVSVSGTWMQRVAQDWLVLQLSGSGIALGTSTALQFLPMLLFGMWGGLVIDRFDKRRLLIGTQVAQAVLALVLAVLTSTGAVELWMVYVLALLLGLVTVVDSPGRQAFVAELVEPDDYVNAQGLNSTIHNAGRLVGPAIAGVLIASIGVAAAFFVNAASFAAVLVALLRMDPHALHRVPPTPRGPGQVREGLRYVWSRPVLRSTIVVVAVVGLFGQNFRVVLPLLAQDTFGQGAGTYGTLMALLGLGAVLGALTSASRSAPSFRSIVTTCFLFALVTFAAAASPTLPFAFAAMVALGFFNITLNTYGRTLLQLRSDRSMHGRVMALHALVFLGSTPFGSYIAGVVSEQWGARGGIAMGGAASLLAGLAYVRAVDEGPSEAPTVSAVETEAQ